MRNQALQHRKKMLAGILAVAMCGLMTACGTSKEQQTVNVQHTTGQSATAQMTQESTTQGAAEPVTQETQAPVQQEVMEMPTIQIQVNQQIFTATLQDNAAARALVAQLPMTISMSELNGNEKYYYLPNHLPTETSSSSQIQNGDLMLYGSDCLVLFYEAFSTSYRYTPMGHIDNPAGLAAAVGRGSITVTFSVK